MSNKTEKGVEYNDGAWVAEPFDNNKKVYVWPYVQLLGNYSSYSTGSNFSYSINGINDWYVYNSNSSFIYLYAYNPVEIQLDEGENLYQEIKNFYEPFMNDENVYYYGSKASGWYNYVNNREFFNNLSDEAYFPDFEQNRTSTWFIDNNSSYYRSTIKDEIGYEVVYYNNFCMNKWKIDEKRLDSCYYYEQYRNKILKLGYRPVVTLKIDAAKNISKKEISSKLKVGDYVNYSAKNYSGWRVLSIDNDAGTVDIVSSGIVKNIQLYSIEDYDNYDLILQNEVDSYKNGDNVISARALEYDDRENLVKMNDKVTARYWIADKKDYNKLVEVRSNYYYNDDESSSKYSIDHTFYEVAYMYYDKGEENSIVKKYGKLYFSPTASEKISYGNSLTFVAGIRPVITLKLSDVELIDSDDVSKISNMYSKLDNKLLNEQNVKNNANTSEGNVYSYSTINSINSSGNSTSGSSGSGNNGISSSISNSGANINNSCGSGCCKETAKNSIISKGYLRFIFYILLLIFIVLLFMLGCFIFLTSKVSCYIDNKDDEKNNTSKV